MRQAPSLIGCPNRIFGGTRLFPYGYLDIYGILYGFAPLVFTDHWELLALSLLVSLACTEGVTFLTCRAELSRCPRASCAKGAEARQARFSWSASASLWNRMNFMQKNFDAQYLPAIKSGY